MKNILKAISLFLILNSNALFACDICGCEMGAGSGATKVDNGIRVGLTYQYQSFEAEINYDSKYFADEKSQDSYNWMNLSASTPLFFDFYLSLNIPIKYNTMRGSHVDASVYGIGDVELYLPYMAWQSAFTGEDEFRHTILLTGGAGFPTGEYQNTKSGKPLSENFQLGSGSYSFLGSVSYLLRDSQWGFVSDASYKTFLENPNKYQKGSSYSLSLNVEKYFLANLNEWRIGLGYAFDHSEHDKENGKNHLNRGGSIHGMNLLVGYNYDVFELVTSVKIPVVVNYNLDEQSKLNSSIKWMISIAWLFSFAKDLDQSEVL